VHIKHLTIPPTVAAFVALTSGNFAHAALLINIDKSAQRMTIAVDDRQVYDWPVSTGGDGYDTPSGTFKPFRMEIDHHSDEYDNAPMPYSVFFTRTGAAIHGTYEQRNLGRAVSHGCVRLSVKHAATLWELVKREKMANTKVVVNGVTPDAAAQSRPIPLNADDPRYALPSPTYPRDYEKDGAPVLVQSPNYDYQGDDQSYGAPMPRRYQPPQDDTDRRSPLPFPFFFGR
jgi:hypothetical protein